jgi:uncharacterized protein
MKGAIQEFQVFVKPTGSICNLGCNYCYYLEKKELYPGKAHFQMGNELLEQYILQHINATRAETIMFSWHGGEPTMAGLDFYRKALDFQQKHLPSGRTIINGIQTNGTLLDDEWCRFLAKENFIAGISMDGPEALHNLFRRDKNGQGTFKKALKGYRMLQEYGLIPEILCVVNGVNVMYPVEVYSFFKQLEPGFITFLPLVNQLPGSQSSVTPDSVPAGDFGRFLVTIFDEWLEKDIGRLKIQIFEEALRTAFNQEHSLCIFRETCGGVPVIEHNGDFYSCDHYVEPQHRLGNILEGSLARYLNSSEQRAFGEAKSNTLPKHCLDCEVKSMCNGECPKNRFLKTPGGESGLNYLCEGYKMFFNHIQPFVEAVRQVTSVSP